MKTLRDYEGAEGVAKFAEIEPYVSEIIKDSNIKGWNKSGESI